MSRFAELVHPELCALHPAAREAALREARRTPFDALELLGIAVALIVAAMFMTYGLAHMLPAATPVESFAVGVPVFAATVGPFVIRRTRRGLSHAMTGARA